MVRIKNRYLLAHILSPELDLLSTSNNIREALPSVVDFHRPCLEGLEPRALVRLIKEQVSLLYGDYGLGLVSGSLKIIYLSTATATAIVKVARDHYRLVWAALSFVTVLPERGKGSRACVMKVVRVSGTIKKVEEEAIRRARKAILRAKGELIKSGLTAVLGREGSEDGGADVLMGSGGSADEVEEQESEEG